MAHRAEMALKSRRVMMANGVSHCFSPQETPLWQKDLSITSIIIRRFLGRTYHKDLTLLLVAVEATFAPNPFLQVSHMLCVIQPALLLWHILWLLPVQGFILEGTKACYPLLSWSFVEDKSKNPSYHQEMCSADWSWVSTGWKYQGTIEPTLFRK